MACINDLTIALTSQFIDYSKRVATTPVSIRGGQNRVFVIFSGRELLYSILSHDDIIRSDERYGGFEPLVMSDGTNISTSIFSII